MMLAHIPFKLSGHVFLEFFAPPFSIVVMFPIAKTHLIGREDREAKDGENNETLRILYPEVGALCFLSVMHAVIFQYTY